MGTREGCSGLVAVAFGAIGCVLVTMLAACAPDSAGGMRNRGAADETSEEENAEDEGEESSEEEELTAAEDDTASSSPAVPSPSEPATPEATPAPAATCDGKEDGFASDGANPAARCCGGQDTKIDTADNCGGCGIKCPSGFGCGSLGDGKWGCNCLSTTSCKSAGYGQDATCYTTGEGAFCNCQCPNGETTCKGVCAGGATCHDLPGQNYCAYD